MIRSKTPCKSAGKSACKFACKISHHHKKRAAKFTVLTVLTKLTVLKTERSLRAPTSKIIPESLAREKIDGKVGQVGSLGSVGRLEREARKVRKQYSPF
jgi:hypothetical protein